MDDDVLQAITDIAIGEMLEENDLLERPDGAR
jgi:hypothetical protein